MKKKILAFVAAALMAVTVVGCGNDNDEPTPPTDPYERYLELAPEDAEVDLSREDAQARAILGACSEWAPGTVDAALQEAYADLIEEQKDQGVINC